MSKVSVCAVKDAVWLAARFVSHTPDNWPLRRLLRCSSLLPGHGVQTVMRGKVGHQFNSLFKNFFFNSACCKFCHDDSWVMISRRLMCRAR